MDQADKNELVQKHMPLVNRVTRAMYARFSAKVEMDEIKSFALIGLASAIEQFNPDKKVPFSAYATIRMKGTIYDEIAKYSYLPRRMVRKIGFYKKADEMMRYASEDPPPKDVVETAHRICDRLKDLACAYVVSHGRGEDPIQPSTPAEAEYLIDRKKYYRRLDAYLDNLPQKNQTLLKMYFFEGISLQKIADEMGRSKSWASRVLRSSLHQLKESFGSEDRPGEIEAFLPYTKDM